MAVNKSHESSIGKTFESTLLKINKLDREGIDSDYDFMKVTDRGEENHTPLITDSKDRFPDGVICGTYTQGKSVFVMMRKNPSNFRDFTAYLDDMSDSLLCEQVTAEDLTGTALLNILLNSSYHEMCDWLEGNNLDGKLYLTFGQWKTKDHVTALKATIEGMRLGFVLKLSGFKFTRIGSLKDEDKRGEAFKKPMFELSDEDNMLHRTTKRKLSNYYQGNPNSDRADIPYSNPKTMDTFKLSKNYIYDMVIETLNLAFGKYLNVSKESFKIEDYLNPDGIDVETYMNELTSKIKDEEYTLINTDPESKDSLKLEEITIRILREGYGKDVVKSDAPMEGRFNLRIIHDTAYYKKRNMADKYRKFPGMAVQHLTIEKCITDDDSDAVNSIMNVLVKELFIKKCLIDGKDLVGNWADRRFDDDMVFLKREKVRDKPKRYKVFRLTMHPDGRFEIDVIDDVDPLLCDTMKDVWKRIDAFSDTEYALIYKDSVCTIQNSSIVPVFNNEVMMEGIKNKKGRGQGRDGKGPRGFVTYNNALYATTDVQRLSFGDDVLYMCGYDGTSIISKYKNAPNIRLVTCIKGENFFHELLNLMNVPFVRHGQTTVYPYPFKFMNEYIEEQKRVDSMKYPKEHDSGSTLIDQVS